MSDYIKNGTVVKLTRGQQKGKKGVIIDSPEPSIGRTDYVVATENFVIGEWIPEDGMKILPLTEENNQFSDYIIKKKIKVYSESYIPENINPYEYFIEASEVDKKYWDKVPAKYRLHVNVYANEGNLPHFHVRRYSEPNVTKHLFICLGSAQYLTNHGDDKSKPGEPVPPLNSKEKKHLHNYLCDRYYQNEEEGWTTPWKYMVKYWKTNNTDTADKLDSFNKHIRFDRNTGEYIMPNYRLLQ